MNSPRDPAPRPDLALEVPEGDAAEQLTPAAGDAPSSADSLATAPREIPPEVPDADALEQSAAADPGDDVPDEPPEVDVLAEADEADVVEQSLPVRLEDDEGAS
jgi:hypothetical protein